MIGLGAESRMVLCERDGREFDDRIVASWLAKARAETCIVRQSVTLCRAGALLDETACPCQHGSRPARARLPRPCGQPIWLDRSSPTVSRYHSPYATSKRPRRWPIILAVLLALGVGAGLGIAATGGEDWFSTARKSATSTPDVVAATEETDTRSMRRPTPRPQTLATPRRNCRRRPKRRLPIQPRRRNRPERARPRYPDPGCRSARGVGQAFLSAWSDGDYHGLYKMLSADSKATISEQDFVDRFDAINTEVGITDITVKTTGGPDLDLNMPINVAYKTGTVGDFAQDNTIHLVREGADWKVDWSPSLIFTQLGDGCVDFMVETVRRGSILDRNGNPLGLRRHGQRDRRDSRPILDEELPRSRPSARSSASRSTTSRRMYADADPDWFVPIKQYPQQVDDATKTQTVADSRRGPALADLAYLSARQAGGAHHRLRHSRHRGGPRQRPNRRTGRDRLDRPGRDRGRRE